MRIEPFPRDVFLEIEPLLYKLYGLNKIWLDNAIHFAKDKLLYDPDEESKVDSDNYIYLPMPHKWYGSRFDEFCKKYSARVGSRYLIYTKDLRKDEQATLVPIYMTGLL